MKHVASNAICKGSIKYMTSSVYYLQVDKRIRFRQRRQRKKKMEDELK